MDLYPDWMYHDESHITNLSDVIDDEFEDLSYIYPPPTLEELTLSKKVEQTKPLRPLKRSRQTNNTHTVIEKKVKREIYPIPKFPTNEEINALNINDSNENCVDCVGCYGCINCFGCENCINCENCIDCKNCVDSFGCRDCIKVDDSNFCSDSVKLRQCAMCCSCFNCIRCEACEKCCDCENVWRGLRFHGNLSNIDI